MRRETLISKIALCLFTLFAAQCHRAPPEPQTPRPPPGQVWLTPDQVKEAKLTIAKMAEHEVGNTILTSAKVTFDDQRIAHVFSPVAGHVTQILASPGQRVKKGAPLAVIDSPDVGSAFSDLQKAQADRVAAEHTYQRAKDLFEAHAGSQQDFEAATDQLNKTRAEFERARQKARLLRDGTAADRVSQEFTLRAPIDGEIVSRNVNPGAEVQGLYSGGTSVELFTIGEIDRVWVLADLFEMDLDDVKLGARAVVKTAAHPRKLFEGRVEWISNSLDPTSHTAKVRVAVDNAGRELKPEMIATVAIYVAERKAPAIPRSAILRLGEQNVVFVQLGTTPDGQLRFERRPVAISEEEGGDYLPVTHGLELGDLVVTSGAVLLSGMF